VSFSDREGERILWFIEAIVDTEEMEEVGEGGRGMSWERREREGDLETNCSLLERSKKTAAKSGFSWGFIGPKCYAVPTRRRLLVVDEMRGTAEEFCQLSGTPQELLALIRRQCVRGGRGLGEGNDWMGHFRLVVRSGGEAGVAHFMGRFLTGDNTARSQIAIIASNTTVAAPLARFGTD